LEEHGLILGRYRPLSELGEGGHGAVDLAFDTKMTRRVAIKRIPLSHAGVRRLGQTTGLAEARTAALLNHPNIVTMYEWDTDEDEAYLIMEHVDGCSLADLLDAYSPLDADEAAAVLTPVCSALAFAHDNGVLHLDLKPENVLVTRDGLVKVADFGVASLTNAAGQAISAGGTLGYMPPEQLRGEAVDARTDSWALGALAYEVVTGSVPFAADSIEEALRKAEDVVPPMPGDIIGAVPREIDDIVMTALAADPDARFTSAAGFGAQLLAVLGDPQSGREALREMVAELVAEEEATAHGGVGGPGLWDRLARTSRRSCASWPPSGAAGWDGWDSSSPPISSARPGSSSAPCSWRPRGCRRPRSGSLSACCSQRCPPEDSRPSPLSRSAPHGGSSSDVGVRGRAWRPSSLRFCASPPQAR
jgi:serine/threonine protein kinase